VAAQELSERFERVPGDRLAARSATGRIDCRQRAVVPSSPATRSSRRSFIRPSASSCSSG